MNGCLVQNTMNTFSEARYYLNVNSVVILTTIVTYSLQHWNLKLYCKERKQGNKKSAYNAITVHWNHADAGIICPSLREPLDITEGLDVVVGYGVW